MKKIPYQNEIKNYIMKLIKYKSACLDTLAHIYIPQNRDFFSIFVICTLAF